MINLDWGTINANARDHLKFTPKRMNLNMVVMHHQNTLEHELKKAEVCYHLRAQGRTFITEAILRNGRRADILVMDTRPAIAYEIMHTEKQESIDEKSQAYEGIRIITISTAKPSPVGGFDKSEKLRPGAETPTN